MRTLIAFILCLFCAASLGQTVNVTYNLQDFTSTPQAVQRVSLQALSPLGTNGNNILFPIKRDQVTSATGIVTYNNVVIGYAYRFTLYADQDDKFAIGSLTNFFTTNLSGTVNAVNYLGNGTNGNPFFFPTYTTLYAGSNVILTYSNGGIYINAASGTNGSGGGSATNLTPWPSDIDAAQHQLTNASGVTITAASRVGLVLTGDSALDDIIDAVEYGGGIGFRVYANGNFFAEGGTVNGTLNVAGPIVAQFGVTVPSGKGVNWNSDAGISRIAANTIAIGNGTPGDVSGGLVATTYNGSPAPYYIGGPYNPSDSNNGLSWSNAWATFEHANSAAIPAAKWFTWGAQVYSNALGHHLTNACTITTYGWPIALPSIFNTTNILGAIFTNEGNIIFSNESFVGIGTQFTNHWDGSFSDGTALLFLSTNSESWSNCGAYNCFVSNFTDGIVFQSSSNAAAFVNLFCLFNFVTDTGIAGIYPYDIDGPNAHVILYPNISSNTVTWCHGIGGTNSGVGGLALNILNAVNFIEVGNTILYNSDQSSGGSGICNTFCNGGIDEYNETAFELGGHADHFGNDFADNSTSNVVCAYNWSHDNSGADYATSANGPNNIFSTNKGFNGGLGFSGIVSPYNSELWDNSGAGDGLIIQGNVLVSGNPNETDLWIYYSTVSAEQIISNVFESAGNLFVSTGGTTGMMYKGNLYWKEDASTPSYLWAWGGVGQANLAAWVSSSGETFALNTNPVTVPSGLNNISYKNSDALLAISSGHFFPKTVAIPDTYLSTNIPQLNRVNNFTGFNLFDGGSLAVAGGNLTYQSSDYNGATGAAVIFGMSPTTGQPSLYMQAVTGSGSGAAVTNFTFIMNNASFSGNIATGANGTGYFSNVSAAHGIFNFDLGAPSITATNILTIGGVASGTYGANVSGTNTLLATGQVIATPKGTNAMGDGNFTNTGTVQFKGIPGGSGYFAALDASGIMTAGIPAGGSASTFFPSQIGYNGGNGSNVVQGGVTNNAVNFTNVQGSNVVFNMIGSGSGSSPTANMANGAVGTVGTNSQSGNFTFGAPINVNMTSVGAFSSFALNVTNTSGSPIVATGLATWKTNAVASGGWSITNDAIFTFSVFYGLYTNVLYLPIN